MDLFQFLNTVTEIHITYFIPITIWIVIWIVILKLGRVRKYTTKNVIFSLIVIGILFLPLSLNLISPLIPDQSPFEKFTSSILQKLNNYPPSGINVPYPEKEEQVAAQLEKEKYIDQTILHVKYNKEKLLLLRAIVDISPGNNAGKKSTFYLISSGLGILFICGFIFFLVKMLLCFRTLSKIKKSAITVTDNILEIFCDTIDELNIRKPIILKRSDKITIPFSFGFIKPTIIIPADMADITSEKESQRIKSVLIHEIAHIQRNDWIVIILQRLCECFFFYNPLIWYIGINLYESQEEVCDAWAIKQKQDWKAYTLEILDYLYKDWKIPYFTNSIIHWPGKLKTRIHAARIEGNNVTTTTPLKKIFMIAAVGLTSLLLLSFTMGKSSRLPMLESAANVSLVLPANLADIYSLETQQTPPQEIIELMKDIKAVYEEDVKTISHTEASSKAVRKIQAAIDNLPHMRIMDVARKCAEIHLLLCTLYYTPQASDNDRFATASRLFILAVETNDYLLLASLYRHPIVTGDYINRKQALYQASDIYYRMKDFNRLGDTFISLGKAYLEDSQYDAAEQIFNSARDIFIAFKKPLNTAIAGSYKLITNSMAAHSSQDAIKYMSQIFSLAVPSPDNVYFREQKQEAEFSIDPFEMKNIDTIIDGFPLLLGLYAEGLLQDNKKAGDNYVAHTSENSHISTTIIDDNAVLALGKRYTGLRQIRFEYQTINNPNNFITFAIWDLWLKKGIGMVKFQFNDKETGESYSWLLDSYYNLPENATGYFPCIVNARWDYTCPELLSAGYKNSYSMRVETSYEAAKEGKSEAEVRYLFSHCLIAFNKKPILSGNGTFIGNIHTENNCYLLYNDTRDQFIEHIFYLTQKELTGVKAAKLYTRFTCKDKKGYLRSLYFQLNQTPQDSNSIGAYPIALYNVGGFVGEPYQTVSRIFDLSSIQYTVGQKSKSQQLNLLKVLKVGENRIKTYVPFSIIGAPVTVMLKFEY